MAKSDTAKHSVLLRHILVVALALHSGIALLGLIAPAWRPFHTWELLGALYTSISLVIWNTLTEQQRRRMLVLPVIYVFCRWTYSWLLGEPMEVYTSTIDALMYFPVLVGCSTLYGVPRWIGAGLSVYFGAIVLLAIQRPELSKSVLNEWLISPAMLGAYFLYHIFFAAWRRHIQAFQALQQNEHELNLALQEATTHQLSTRMNAVSKFSGEFAHEFNNLLAIVSPLTTMLITDLQGTEQEEDLRDIQSATERMRSLSQQLLSLTQTSRILEEETNLIDVFQDLSAEIERSTQHELADLRLRCAQTEPDTVIVSGPQQDLQKLIALLATHIKALAPDTAQDAVLTVINGDDMQHPLKETWHDKIALISIGHSIETEKVPTSTAHIGLFAVTDVGSELGLVTAYTTAVRAGGTIRVGMQENRLTHFHVYLPIIQRSAEPPRAERSQALSEITPAPLNDSAPLTADAEHGLPPRPVPPTTPAQPPARRSEVDKDDASTTHTDAEPRHILLVDDEPLLLKALRRGLISRGMHVTSTTSALDALEILRQDDTRFDALVSDVRMPGLSGPEMIQRAQNEGLTLPLFIYITGHVDNHAAASFKVSPERVLFKPFTVDTLHARIESLLAQTSSAQQAAP